MKAQWKKTIKRYREPLLYLVLGVATTAVNWVVYTLAMLWPNAHMTVCNALAWGCAVTFAFVTNKQWVFERRCWAWRQTMREAASFLGARVLSGLVEIFLPTWLVAAGLDAAFLGIPGFTAKALVSVAVIVMNYVLSKLLVFKK